LKEVCFIKSIQCNGNQCIATGQIKCPVALPKTQPTWRQCAAATGMLPVAMFRGFLEKKGNFWKVSGAPEKWHCAVENISKEPPDHGFCGTPESGIVL